MGKCEIVDDQFRAVVLFLEVNRDSSEVPPKQMYEMICQYVGKLEEVSTFSTTVLQKCDAEVAEYMADNGPKRGKLFKYLSYSMYTLDMKYLLKSTDKCGCLFLNYCLGCFHAYSFPVI